MMMIIDFTNKDIRNQMLDDLQPIIVDYVTEQLDENLPKNMTAGDYSTELSKIMRYLDDHLTIEFKW